MRGHPGSYHMPARLRVIEGADSPQVVVDGRPAPELVGAFKDAARELAEDGACLITSTCGFLVSVQHDIAAVVPVPVMLSAMSLLPFVHNITGRRPVGVLTASASALGTDAIGASGIAPEQVRVQGLQDRDLFRRTFLSEKSQQHTEFDPADMQDIVCCAAADLVRRHPEIGAIVLECGNLPPYGGAIQSRVNRPVYSILDGARLVSGQGA